MFVLKKRLRDTCTAHYLGKGYPHACKNIHGHNYHYMIEIGGNKLNEHDMLVDFKDIKTYCDKWLQDNWDHVTVLSSFQNEAKNIYDKMGWRWVEFPVPDVNTTAENMAKFLAEKFYKELKEIYPNVEYLTVHIWETDDSEASYKVSE